MGNVLSVSTNGVGSGIRAITGVFAGASAANATGIYGSSTSTSGWGVFGYTPSSTGSTAGVRGEVESSASGATGVFGLVGSSSGSGTGVKGQSNGTAGYGIWGQGGNGATGVLGQANSATRYGVWAYNLGTGVALRTEGNGNLIEAWSITPVNKRFAVDNNGDVTADGTYMSPAADFAELLPSSEYLDLEPDDVLALDEDGSLVKSSKPYQKSVAGVYSTKPAFLGGHKTGAESIGQVPLAVIGIVPVKVTNENGAIKAGDLLVASQTPGYAMKGRKNTPNGTVIGKALDSFNQDRGKIKMLAILQ